MAEITMNDDEEQERTLEKDLLFGLQSDVQNLTNIVIRYNALFDRELNLINKKLDHIRFGITLGFLLLALSVTALWWVR